ncbi:hypothetical protein MMAN_30570 [Mycobacterium mantenii]|uniref:Lipopolysaccharide assembly protein A domain-containing protein n=2 Tax=Mycobacterium mantenii TaxID=560555 RepID=A0A1X0G3J6_MYCNT|nr:hypothetical protein [Mycobacterium mantenii]MCV7244055.1 hypothetical protein [Mycobacterium mantenii]ORB08574.1 hypothetical protein BST30_04505 [Mycobacterium mantenii]BBY38923.1 hypothetical protein MMAN_30570 [Mycobacterium mantenii]
MIVIVGLAVLFFAVVVGFLGVLNNAGAAHPLSENFSVLGYHVTGSTGTLFLFGIVIGALAMLGMSVLLAGARRTAARGRDARRELERSQREVEFVNRDREFQNQPVGTDTGSMANSQLSTTRPRRKRGSLLGRRSWGRQPTAPRGGGRR